MGKGWSVFFGAVLFGTFIIWFAAPVFGWWLPDNVASYGDDVDFLFYLILAMTTFFFVLTEVVLVYAMWKFTSASPQTGLAGEVKSTYTHGNHILEIVWTAIPAALLLFIAISQISVWDRIKYQKSMPSPDITVSVMARQWEWRMRYPVDSGVYKFEVDAITEKPTDPEEKAKKSLAARAWAENPQFDDIHVANEIHCYVNANVKVYLQTRDVLHSFSMPNLRIKQDTVPGKTIPMWFKPIKHNTEFDARTGKLIESGDKADSWEIACQELCGGRHYAMRGRLYVHRDKASFDAWLAHTRKLQESRGGEAGKVALNP